VCEREREREK
jgi:hypothetical protein